MRLGRLWSQPGDVWVGFGGFLLISGDDVMKNSSRDLDRRSMIKVVRYSSWFGEGFDTSADIVR